jgi:hypothetical protein
MKEVEKVAKAKGFSEKLLYFYRIKKRKEVGQENIQDVIVKQREGVVKQIGALSLMRSAAEEQGRIAREQAKTARKQTSIALSNLYNGVIKQREICEQQCREAASQVAASPSLDESFSRIWNSAPQFSTENTTKLSGGKKSPVKSLNAPQTVQSNLVGVK